MRISHRFRFIFFSFPKTASVSVRRMLDPVSDIRSTPEYRVPGGRIALAGDGSLIIPGHVSPIELRSLFRENNWPFESYFKFVFVRNPWARLVSLYRMICDEVEGFQEPFPTWLLGASTGSLGIVDDGVGRWRRYGTYTLGNFVNDELGKRLVDKVFRLEDIELFPAELRKRGIPLPPQPIRRMNSKPPVDLNAYYTMPALKAVVAARYADEIAEFGYSYPG